jgi:mono/diheme cytochrome c family protein
LSNKLRFPLAVAALSILAVAGMVAFQASKISNEESATFREALAASNDLQIERGEYLALAGNCASCHTTGSGGFMAGGVSFETPFGTIYSTNITPDPDTGIGDWSALQFLNSMRHGVRADGQHLYPAFPYTAFTKVTDEDLAALFAYLTSIPAIRQENTENDIAFPFSVRSLMAVWKTMFLDEGTFVADESRSAEWNRGAYLVDALAHCGACHTPRNILGAENYSMTMAGGVYTDKVPSGNLRPWSAPNLTSAPNGLGLWQVDELTSYLKTGINAHVATFGPMNEVIINSTRHLIEADVTAMAVYLKSLPPIEPGTDATAPTNVLGMGRTLYNLHCGTCHLPTGLGDVESAPQLATGSLVVQARNPASLINVILDGPQMPEPPLATRWRKPMEDFRYVLTDDEVAALASYLRHEWDNTGGEVTADQVAKQR